MLELVAGQCRAEQASLDVVQCQWLAKERIGEQVDLSHGQIVRRAPVGVHETDLVSGERSLGGGGTHGCPPALASIESARQITGHVAYGLGHAVSSSKRRSSAQRLTQRPWGRAT